VTKGLRERGRKIRLERRRRKGGKIEKDGIIESAGKGRGRRRKRTSGHD
jgi:hypothetical protein